MRISADQNGVRLIKMAREEIGLQPRSKIILRHAQQDFDTEVFLFSIFRVPGKSSVIRVSNAQSNVQSSFTSAVRHQMRRTPRSYNASGVVCVALCGNMYFH